MSMRLVSIGILVLAAACAYAQEEGGNWPQPKDKTAHVEDKWKGNPPDKIDSDGVPVYRNRMGPVGVIYRKRSIDDPPEKGCEHG